LLLFGEPPLALPVIVRLVTAAENFTDPYEDDQADVTDEPTVLT